MKVYRYLTEEELNMFQNGDISNAGSLYEQTIYKGKNTHKYKPDTRYLHFFKNKEDIAKVKELHKESFSDYYICDFNIPITTLIRHMGHGYYNGHGYDCDHEKVFEFAIPVDKISCDYLNSYEFDQEHHHNRNQTRNIPIISFESNKEFK